MSKYVKIGTCGKSGKLEVLYSFKEQRICVKHSEIRYHSIKDYEQAINWCKTHLPGFAED